MKITRLPDTDLANFALLPCDEKRHRLIAFRLGHPKLSWRPFRSTLPAIYNAQKSLFALRRCSWDEIQQAIERGCKSHPDWLTHNLSLTKVLFDFNQRRELAAVEREFGTVPIGYGAHVKLWSDFFFVRDDRLVISFFDPRRGKGLTERGRRFAFSVMKHSLGTGDFCDATFEIVRFPVDEEGQRTVQIFQIDEHAILDLDVLNAKIQETYEIWVEILDDRERKRRRAS